MNQGGAVEALGKIAEQFAKLKSVEAVALAGSSTSGSADEHSDFDIYVYSRQNIEVSFRDRLIKPMAQSMELHRTFWEDEDVWVGLDGRQFEFMYRPCEWTESELKVRLEQHQACLGYTTAICYNVEKSQILWDRSGWFARQQAFLAEGYPEGLARSIVRKNLPVMGTILSSYEDQVQSASRRKDLVSLNHRVAAWLASYFDILFAANFQFHPGEKKLLWHAGNLPDIPDSMNDDIDSICQNSFSHERSFAQYLGEVRGRLETLLCRKSLLS